MQMISRKRKLSEVVKCNAESKDPLDDAWKWLLYQSTLYQLRWVAHKFNWPIQPSWRKREIRQAWFGYQDSCDRTTLIRTVRELQRELHEAMSLRSRKSVESAVATRAYQKSFQARLFATLDLLANAEHALWLLAATSCQSEVQTVLRSATMVTAPQCTPAELVRSGSIVVQRQPHTWLCSYVREFLYPATAALHISPYEPTQLRWHSTSLKQPLIVDVGLTFDLWTLLDRAHNILNIILEYL